MQMTMAMAKLGKFFRNLFSVRVIITGVETDDYDVHLRCINEKCAAWNESGCSCNCKNIMIGADGKCATFIKKDDKNGKFPVF